VSVSFYGMTADREPIALDIEDPAHLNLANGKARSFLGFLGLEPGEDLYGETSLPEVRRAIMRARATFKRTVGCFAREGSDTMRPGRCRVVEGGIDAGYFARRLDDFERFLGAVAERGARSIYWG